MINSLKAEQDVNGGIEESEDEEEIEVEEEDEEEDSSNSEELNSDINSNYHDPDRLLDEQIMHNFQIHGEMPGYQ